MKQKYFAYLKKIKDVNGKEIMNFYLNIFRKNIHVNNAKKNKNKYKNYYKKMKVYEALYYKNQKNKAKIYKNKNKL